MERQAPERNCSSGDCGPCQTGSLAVRPFRAARVHDRTKALTERRLPPDAAAARTIWGMISREEVEHVAELARLGLTADEIDRMQTQLSRILEAIEQLRDVDTSQVGPTAQVIELENVMRDDVARPGLSREAALANAPQREGPLLRVPTVLAEGR